MPKLLTAVLLLLMLSVARMAAQEEEEATPVAKDAHVWALDDTDKVHPVTGNLLSEGAEVYNGQRPSKGEYRRRNSVWDAATNTIRLRAGRNEFVSFQVVIEKGQQELHKVFLNATDLFGSKERISADRNVKLFRELYVPLHGTWYADGLLPFELAGATPFELPDYQSGPRGQRVQTVWVDIYVPHNLPPDTYTGQILVLHRNTNRQAVLKVELTVAGFTLPDKLGLDVDLMNYGFLNVERGWPELVQNSPRHRAIEREFFRMAHAHRTTFAVVPYNHDGSIPPGQKPRLEGVGTGTRVAGWEDWDERYGPVLSGSAFADLPRAGVPVDHFFLPYNLMWPSDMTNWGTPRYREEHLAVSRELRRHFAAKGWTKTLYEIYYNHKEGYGFYPWNLDEPTRPKDLDALRTLGSILKESFPANDPVRVMFRLDIGHFHCENVRDCQLPRETSRTVTGTLGEYVQLWNIGAPHYLANLPDVRKLKAAGKTMYFYGSTPQLEQPLLTAALWGWQGYRYEADGVCLWNATDWGDWDTDAAPGDPYQNAGGRYAGASMIFYPGSRFGHDGPLASIRLKTMRRGMQDFEYLRMVEQSGHKTRAELATMADRVTKGGLIEYDRQRTALFELLSK